jgi:hypothetical protein
MEDTTESDPREVEAASFNLNYVQVSISRWNFFLAEKFWDNFLFQSFDQVFVHKLQTICVYLTTLGSITIFCKEIFNFLKNQCND